MLRRRALVPLLHTLAPAAPLQNEREELRVEAQGGREAEAAAAGRQMRAKSKVKVSKTCRLSIGLCSLASM